ncbi:hypothetical protein D3C76_1339270 [compost metagenome]
MDSQLAIVVLGFAAPDGHQLAGFQAVRFHMAQGGKRRPFLIPGLAIRGAVEVAGAVGIDFDFAAFALDHYGVIAEQLAGLTVHPLVAGMEDALQAATRAERVEDARQGVDRGTQAEGIAQIDHPLQLRCPGSEGDERQLALVQRLGHLLPVLAEWDAQQFQQLLAVEAPGGVCAAAMQEDA